MRDHPTPLRALARGLAAGIVATGLMTLHQELVAKAQGSGGASDGDRPDDPWEGAPAPALVGKRLLEGVFGVEVGADRIGLLTHAMHWGYGIANGGLYGLLQASVRTPPLALGPLFGAGVWASSYAQLVPMGIYEPPWTHPPETLANDVGYHLTYGGGLAAGWKVAESAL
jgi:hypothetical protein